MLPSAGRHLSTTGAPPNTVLLAKEGEDNDSKAPRHDVGKSAREPLPPALQKQMEAYQEHQQAAPKLGFPTDVRTLVQYNHGFAVLSTHSKSDPDYPGGSVVGFAPDEQGRPLFIFSGMSTHTQDILANPHCSLTVAAKDFKGAADGRVNLMGRCELIKDAAERDRAKEIYKQKHPGASSLCPRTKKFRSALWVLTRVVVDLDSHSLLVIVLLLLLDSLCDS